MIRPFGGLVLCLFVVVTTGAYALEFTSLKPFNQKSNLKWGPVLKDVMNHEAPGDSNNYADRITLAHETSHGIHAYLRNHLSPAGRRYNAFYVLKDRAVFVPEPRIRKRQVGPYVPRSLRASRYSVYVTGQTAWDDTPLYIWDEWNAYVNGGEAGVELSKLGLWNDGWRDAVMGQLEFVVYALATGMAVKENDPNYFKDETQFTDFLAWNTERALKSFHEGAAIPDFAWAEQEEYLASLRTAEDAEALREFTRQTFGKEWSEKVLGF